jgi:hypothetical protein
MNSAPNANPTESDNVLIVSADKGREHPDREIAPAGREPKAEDSKVEDLKVEDLKAEVPKAEDPKAISGDALIERADIGQAQADEQIAANEQVTPSASDPKATQAASGLIEPADEPLAREAEQISEPEPDAVQDPLLVPSLVTSHPSAGRPALRGLIGLLSAASIFVAAFIAQSSHIASAKQTVARWVAQLGSTSSEPLNQSERRVSRVVSAAQLNAAESMASPPAPSPRTAPQEVAASLSLDQAQMLQAIARDLAKLGQRVEELSTRQEQMAGANAKLDLAKLQAMAPDLVKLGQRLEEFNTRQEQMAGANAKAIEQLTASQDQLAENIKAIQQLEKTQEQVARDNAKTAEQIKAGRDQIARFLAARASEQNPQPRTLAPRPHPFAAPPR